jgi:regulatory protein
MENFEKLLNKTYKFLSFRPRSIKEVEDYLKKKKTTDVDLKRVIEKLKSQKFLNDEEFARWWIESRTKARPRSSRLITLELKQKGIEKELIDSIFENSKEIASDFEKAYALALKRAPKLKNLERQKAYEKLARFLASRGFNWDTIKEVIDQVLK